jgi:pimeloyl-ACP methyl ester carboxylesterase
VVSSKDGTQISYSVHGAGEPTLVFVHGWSCDTRYWRNQIDFFSQNHKIVLIDLAGHGHSGMNRDDYTIEAFGEDVKAVVEAIGSKNVILIGHSMGGAVIAQAALLLPMRVKGLIGVDTYHNIEYPLSQEEFEIMVAPFKENFQKGTHQFVQQMQLPNNDTELNKWIQKDMSSAPPNVAISAMTELMSKSITGKAAQVFKEISIPIIAVNGDMWPTNLEANRRHMSFFEAIVVKNSDHFLMMNRSDEFNKALKQAIKSIVENVKK